MNVRFACVLVTSAFAVAIPAATLPTGFTEIALTSSLSSATAMALAPDGRIFVCEQGGTLRVIKNGALLPQPFLTLTVSSVGERGLLGVAFDPGFLTNHFLYVYYTSPTPSIHNRVSRFTANGDVVASGSEIVLLDLDNLSSATNHNGGATHFGPDGKLYIAVGENANGANSQTLSNLLGKILRINANGTIPTDNPFYNQAIGNNRAIWALGLRNPFTFTFQNGTGRMFINDVGENTWEEINDGLIGSNYGWPTTEGETTDARFVSPLFVYGHGTGPTVGCAITGGAFYNPGTVRFSGYTGKYFFADNCGGWIRTYDPAADTAAGFATGAGGVVDLFVSDSGKLYYLNRSSVFEVDSGSSGGPGSATFVGTDMTTQGNWKSVYGSQGHNVIPDAVSYPAYVTVNSGGVPTYTWAPSTTDVRGLQKAASPTDRVAGCWYTNGSSSFIVDLNFTDSAMHQVAFYFVDWDSYGRNLRLQMLDANNVLLDTQNLPGFVNGAYLIWKLSGHVKLQVTNLGGGNPVLSGIFFGAASGLSVAVAPPSVSLGGAQTQTFTASVTGSSNQSVTWSLSAGAPGSISTGGTYTAPPTIASPQTISVIATAAADGTTTGTATVNLLPAASGGVTFVQTDLTTKGNWKSVYGGEGYHVIQDTALYPSYVSVNAPGVTTYTWEPSTADPRGLQKAASATDRIAGCWYTNASTSFLVDLSFLDMAQHQVAFYFVDWDSYGRNLRVQVLDGNNNVLDTQNLSTFTNGAYLVWKLSGHVTLRVTNLGGGNPVLSGIFFGAATGNRVTVSPSSVNLAGGQSQTFTATVTGISNQAVTWSLGAGAPGSISTGGTYIAPATIASAQTISVVATAADGISIGSAAVNLLPAVTGTASFVQADLTTKGNWKSVYGSQGYSVIQDTALYPSYAAVTPLSVSSWTWQASTSDVRALQKAASGTDRIAACWYTNASTSFLVDLNFSDTVQHQVAFYFVDWDSYGRNLRVQVLDANNTVLDTQSLTSFLNGTYLVWKLTGHVRLQVTNLGGGNPVMSGLFFQ